MTGKTRRVARPDPEEHDEPFTPNRKTASAWSRATPVPRHHQDVQNRHYQVDVLLKDIDSIQLVTLQKDMPTYHVASPTLRELAVMGDQNILLIICVDH